MEEAFEKRFSVRSCGRLARAETLVNIFKRFLFILSRILFEAADNRAVIDSRIDRNDLLESSFLKRTNDRLSKRLKGTCKHDALVRIDNIFCQNEVGYGVALESIGHRNLIHIVKEIKDLRIGAVAHGTEQCCEEKFTTTAAAIEVDIKEVVLVELNFEPCPAVWDDTEGVKNLAGCVDTFLEGDTRRSVKLADDDTLSAINDERATLGHHR